MSTAQTTRSAIWHIMSELYLDQEKADSDYKRVADALAASSLDASEFESILFNEVHPVCCLNMRVPAGEWVEFDKAVLTERIEAHLAKLPVVGWMDRQREKRDRREIEELRTWILPHWQRVNDLVKLIRESDA